MPHATGPEAPADIAPQPRDPDRYVILGEHGRGGLGRVSRARDRELGRDVAIKELIARGDLGEARFLREALITARLEHPGIVPVHEAGRWPDGTPFYAMKLVAGRPLRDVLAEKTTVDSRIALLHHVIAVADAIAYAHGRNIIHRDLKPSNVIVGDFGETVVIDWGLAKDLTTSEDPHFASASPSPNRDEHLTSTGSVLGTPAYMPPEQLRGEPVDQRADVYAIGAMLWELCSLEKLPPNYTGQRHRILRRAGIDQDLATIALKALTPDPADRYSDAGALAADLKAFKAGARIAARRYSLWALLAHWVRRYRALALSVMTAIVISAIGVARYVRDIGAQRDRADASEKAAKRAQTTAETSVQELILKHAQALLSADPTEAASVLSKYRGADQIRADQLLAEAKGLGVALLRATPHTDNILWAQGTSTGEILSLSIDGTLSTTSNDGSSKILYRGVEPSKYLAYAPRRHLLAFTCDSKSLCLYDTLREARIPLASIFRDLSVVGLSFSPDGRLLALMSKSAVLRVFDVSNSAFPLERLRKQIYHGWDVKFVDMNTIAVDKSDGGEFVSLNGESHPFHIAESADWDSSSEYHELAQATSTGEVFILTLSGHVKANRRICHGAIVGVRFIPGMYSVGYACRDGAVGVWDIHSDSARTFAQREGHVALFEVSPSGDYLIAAGGASTVTLVDLQTEIVSTYRGHDFRVTSITPPTRSFPFLISADARGSVRKWPLPPRLARVVARTNARLDRVIFGAGTETIIATSSFPVLTVYSPTTGVQTLSGHEAANLYIERSPDGRSFATYGSEIIEIWDISTMTRTQTIRTAHSVVTRVKFVDNTNRIATAGYDGKLVLREKGRTESTLAQLGRPINALVMLPHTQQAVLSTIDGCLWYIDEDHRVHLIRETDVRITQLVAVSDRKVYIGDASGDVMEIDPKSSIQHLLLHDSHGIRQIVTNGDMIVVSTNGGIAYMGTGTDGKDNRQIAWTPLPARVGHVSLSAEFVVAACSDGAVWLYSMPHHAWIYATTGGMNLGWTAISESSNLATALDSEGHIVWMDLKVARSIATPISLINGNP